MGDIAGDSLGGEAGAGSLGVLLPESAIFSVGSAEALEGKLKSRVQGLIQSGELKESEVRFVREFTLPAASGSLDVDQELLERLRRAAQIWDVSLKQPEFTSHRKVIGPFIVGLKKLLYPIVSFFMADTLQQQRDFNASVLRCLVELARKK